MDLKIYEYILTVAEKKSITRAAEVHFISQPTLSQHIKNIEKRYGIRLFEKVSGKLEPTKEGEIFLTNAENMIKVMNRTERELKNHTRHNSDTIRIFIDMYFRNAFLNAIQPAFEKEYPSLKLSFMTGDTGSAYKCMEENVVNAAVILTNEPLPASFDGIILHEEEMMMLSSEPLTGKINNDILAEQPVYLLKNNTFYADYGKELLKSHKIPYTDIRYFEHLSDIFSQIRSAGGFTFAPESYIAFHHHEDLPHISLTPQAGFHLIFTYHHRQGMTDPLRSLLEISRQYFTS